MKKFLWLLMIQCLWSMPVFSEALDVQLLRSISTPVAVKQMATTADGKTIYLLLNNGAIQLRGADGQLEGSFDAGADVIDMEVLGTNRLLLKMKDNQELLIVGLRPRVQISTQESPTLGPSSAVVTIAVFDDFQCPYCSKLVEPLKVVLDKYPEQVRLVFKNFPLTMHQHARIAATAGLAAQKQGEFWPLHDLMFANYRQLTPEKIRKLAETLPLDMDRFEADINDPALGRRIDSDIREGKSIGVRGTPTLFINGRRVQKRSVEEMSRMINEELARLTGAKS